MENTEDIRKKEKKLSQYHWMCRIQKYTFGIDAPNYYMGYCPFFWMTWVSLLVFPIVFIGKTAFKLTSAPVKPVFKALNDRQKAKLKELSKVPLEPNFHVILNVYRAFGDEDSFIQCGEEITIENCSPWLFSAPYSKAARIRLWFIQNPNWRQTHLEKARIEYKEYRDRIEREEREAVERQKRRDACNRKLSRTASMCGRGIFKVIIPTLILGLAVLVYLAVAKLIAIITLQAFILALSLAFSILAGIITTKILFDFCFTFVFTEKLTKKLTPLLAYFFADDGLLFKIIDKTKEMWVFVKDTVALTYKAECPLIVWGDETGKITKRENRKNSN